MRWDTAWTAIKDVMLTGTGMVLILSQVFSDTPSDLLLVTGLALTVPSVAAHAGNLLSGSRGPSSPSRSPPGPLPSGHSPTEATDNGE